MDMHLFEPNEHAFIMHNLLLIQFRLMVGLEPYGKRQYGPWTGHQCHKANTDCYTNSHRWQI